jgi:hypothetical protein
MSYCPITDPGTNWNANPWLFGVKNGVIELQTGKLRAGLPSDRITFHSDLAFNPLANSDLWLQFLDDIFLSVLLDLWPAKTHENHLEVRSQRRRAVRSYLHWRSRGCVSV